MVRDWRVAVRVEYFDGTLYRAGGIGGGIGAGGGAFRVAGLFDPADSGLGLCAVLFAVECVHDAGISGTAV